MNTNTKKPASLTVVVNSTPVKLAQLPELSANEAALVNGGFSPNKLG